MSTSVQTILTESVSKKKKYLKYLLPIIILGGGSSAYFMHKSNTPSTTVYIPEIYEAVQGSISSSVSSDGNIINPDILNLSFLINGTLDSVYVKEGDKVEAGKILAELDKRDLKFDLQSAQNDVNIAWQNIKAKESDITDTDIINAQSDFEITQNQIEINKKNALQNFTIEKENAESKKRTAEQDLEQAFEDVKQTLTSSFLTFSKALQEVDYVFAIEEHYAGKTITSTFNNSIGENKVENYFQKLGDDLTLLRSEYENEKQNLTNDQILEYIERSKDLASSLDAMFDEITVIFSTARERKEISQATILSTLASLQGYQSQIQGIESTLSQTTQTIDRAHLNLENTLLSISNDLKNVQQNYQKTVADSDNSLKSAELKISNSEKSVNKSNISKQTSLSIQYAQLAQSKLKVEKAQYNVDLATLKAPKSGTIIQVKGSAGESVKADVTDPDTAFIRILSDANFTTEVYVEEVDIAQIQIGQNAKITLDALPDTELQGTVRYISSTAEIDNNGIVTYLVRIDITDGKEASIREGMTTYVDFILGQALDVVIIPNSAIIRGRSVELVNGERKELELGFTDGEFTEVKSGLSVGEKIISNPQTGSNNRGDNTQGGRGSDSRGSLSPERLAQMKEAGFTDEELTKLQAGEFTDEMRAKMQKMRESAGGSDRNVLGGGAPRGGGGGGNRGGGRAQ